MPSAPLRLVPAALLFLGALGGCRTQDAEALYREALADYGSHHGTGGLREEVLERQNARFEKVRAWAEEGTLESTDDLVYAAALLATSDHHEDVELAHDLAWTAAERGDPRGSQIAAEALDKLHLSVGLPQVYGTQYVFEPAIGTWRLYPVDPATTDEQRRLMGIAPLSELEARAAELNRRDDPAAVVPPTPVER